METTGSSETKKLQLHCVRTMTTTATTSDLTLNMPFVLTQAGEQTALTENALSLQ